MRIKKCRLGIFPCLSLTCAHLVPLARRSLPKKVTDAMTCSECCKDRVLLTQETRDGMEKYMMKAVNTPWVVGEQHLKMNEFLTSMDQVRNFPTTCV